MAAPILILKALAKALAVLAKAKTIKKGIDFFTKKNNNKVDALLSFLPSFAGKAARQFRRFQKVNQAMNKKIAHNLAISKRLRSGEKINKWSLKKVGNNILRAKEIRNKWIKNEVNKGIKRKLLKLVPGKRIFLSVKGLSEAINDKKSWLTITKKFGNVMSSLGVGEVNKVLGIIDKGSSISLTINQYWKKISVNHSAYKPIIDTHGGAKLRYARRYKDKYQKQIFDRTFYFNVFSPQTGNFSTGLHCYDPVIKQYTLPIRSAFGNIKEYSYFGNDFTSSLDKVLNLVCSKTIDFGSSIFSQMRSYDQEPDFIAMASQKDPNYMKKNKKRNI